MPVRKSIKRKTKIPKLKKTKKTKKNKNNMKRKNKQKGGVKCLTVDNSAAGNANATPRNETVNKVEFMGGSSQDIAFYINDSKKISLLIAGNPGRPGGALGSMDGSGISKDRYGKQKNFWREFGTQEESVVASWLQAEYNLIKSKNHEIKNDQIKKQLDNIFKKELGINATKLDGEIGQPWGMLDPDSTSVKTIQKWNYTLELKPGATEDEKEIYKKGYEFAYSLLNKPILLIVKKIY